MRKFVGDLSVEDAEIIERYAKRAKRVLEFGVGGSTQIIAQVLPKKSRFVTVDTDPRWIRMTHARLGKLGVQDRCRFLSYARWLRRRAAGTFDLIFIDGQADLRCTFAKRAWSRLTSTGVMLFHDTRRTRDVVAMLSVVLANHEEVASIRMNERYRGASSNISVVRKKPREPRVDWHAAEDKPSWMYGQKDVPEEFW